MSTNCVFLWVQKTWNYIIIFQSLLLQPAPKNVHLPRALNSMICTVCARLEVAFIRVDPTVPEWCQVQLPVDLQKQKSPLINYKVNHIRLNSHQKESPSPSMSKCCFEKSTEICFSHFLTIKKYNVWFHHNHDHSHFLPQSVGGSWPLRWSSRWPRSSPRAV